jgi:defect-in-organelle-trafficking protein DotC
MRRSLLTLPALLALGGCAQTHLLSHLTSGPSVSVNAGQSMLPEGPTDNAPKAPPSLKAMENIHAVSSGKASKMEALKMPAIRDEALKYGVDGGLAWSTMLINQVIRAESTRLSQVYDFNSLVTHGPHNSLILPPVISESTNLYQSSNFGRTIRVANRYYKIIHEASFVPNAPLWFSYLYRPWHNPQRPFNGVLPKNAAEQQAWREYVKIGWKMGVKQGETVFRLDLDRLNRDFDGMIRYRALYDAGKVSAPIVTNKYLGTTGSGRSMREGDRVMKIIQEPSLMIGR